MKEKVLQICKQFRVYFVVELLKESNLVMNPFRTKNNQNLKEISIKSKNKILPAGVAMSKATSALRTERNAKEFPAEQKIAKLKIANFGQTCNP